MRGAQFSFKYTAVFACKMLSANFIYFFFVIPFGSTQVI